MSVWLAQRFTMDAADDHVGSMIDLWLS